MNESDRAATPWPEKQDGAVERTVAGSKATERLYLYLGGLAPQVRAEADRQQTSMANVIRAAIRAQLKTQLLDSSKVGHDPKLEPLKPKSVSLWLQPRHAAVLAARSRASALTSGGYVGALLDGLPPAPLPEDLGPAIAALRESNVSLAALAVDLNSLLRQLGPAAPVRLSTLAAELRAHLHCAAGLVATLGQLRRPKC